MNQFLFVLQPTDLLLCGIVTLWRCPGLEASTWLTPWLIDFLFAELQIRAAEDLLSLTRYMKEAWLFEKLNTVGEDEHDIERNRKLEEDVAAVKEVVLQGLVQRG